MEFRILGPLEVLRHGRPIALGGDKQRALLALLLIHANRTLSSDRLIDELWGERPPATAAKAVQVHISRLRKALGEPPGAGDGVLVTREHGYALKVDPENLDSLRFERLLGEARGELAADRVGNAASLLERALSLWRGPPLSEFAYERFAEVEIARLEELQGFALEELTEVKLGLGRHAEVVGNLESLIAQHPYRERLRAQLMLAFYRSDRQAEALQAYQDARRKLVEELGIEPGERLRELERAILAQDPELILTSVEGAATKPSAQPATPFVGREREFGQLTATLNDACSHNGRLVLVVGEPGIGKSRLAEELVAQAHARGFQVLIGRCWEAGGAPAYWPWTQVLQGLTRELEPERLRRQLAHDGGELVRLVPELGERLPDLPVPTGPLGEGARFRLLASVSAFLRRCASSRPVAIFIDDLHAADEPSLLLLRFIAGQLAGSQILIVACCRDTEVATGLATSLAELTRAPAARRIPLMGLSATETSRLLAATIGQTPADEVASRVHAETEGNPFFATEIGRLLGSEDSGGCADVTLPIPETVMEAVARRLERQSAWCRETLTLASVFGREFDPAVVEAVGGASEEEVYGALEEAASARLLVGLPNAPGRLRFSHILIRDALYESIPAPRRVRLHRAIGAALEMLYSENPEPHLAELARHFLAGGTPVRGKAIEYAQRAGNRAASQLAHVEAARHYKSALDLLDSTGSGDADRACELLLSLGEALSRAGRGQEAREVLQRAATLAEETARTDRLARAAVEYGGRFAWARASTDPFLVPLLERALAAIGEVDSVERVKLLARLATATRDDPSRDRRIRIAEEAVQIATRLNESEPLALALEGQWTAVEGPDTAGGGIEPGAMLVKLGEQTGDKERALVGHEYRLNGFWTLGDRVGVDVELDAIASLAYELGQPAQRWILGTNQTMLALMEGRLADAEQQISDTVALGRRSQSWNAVVSQRFALFVLRRAQGRLEEFEDTLRRSVREYPPLLRFRCALAHAYGELGRKDDASAALDELMTHDLANEHVDAEWLLSMTLLADVSAIVEDQDAAARLQGLLAPYQRLYNVAPVEVTFGSVARALGVVTTVLERFDTAEQHFASAIETERKMKAPPWLAHTQHNIATMLLRRGAAGDNEQARALLQDTYDTYRELGMNLWAARADELLRASHSGHDC
ncbi:MAG: BTAD domain-containing putative transcriptional regulator [Solirubrobacteraceae bacterium]